MANDKDQDTTAKTGNPVGAMTQPEKATGAAEASPYAGRGRQDLVDQQSRYNNEINELKRRREGLKDEDERKQINDRIKELEGELPGIQKAVDGFKAHKDSPTPEKHDVTKK